MDATCFCKALDRNGLEVFAWLTPAQVHFADDSTAVFAYCELDGRMIPCTVQASELTNVEEV